MTQRVLIIDDDESQCRLLAQMVGDLKCEAEYETSACRALDRLQEVQPDLLFLDIRMPEMSGLELLGRVRASGANMPIVMVTAHGDLKTAKKAMKLGAHDYVVKPINAEELRSIVTDYL